MIAGGELQGRFCAFRSEKIESEFFLAFSHFDQIFPLRHNFLHTQVTIVVMLSFGRESHQWGGFGQK